MFKDRFDSEVPMFFFVIEDMDRDGNPVRPHAHGSIEIKPMPIEVVDDARAWRHIAMIERKLGRKVAEDLAGRWAVRAALKLAAGVNQRRGKIASTGISQSRNIWLGKPTLPIFNPDWVTYAFKNVGEIIPVLSENRLVMPYSILGEARRLWAIIRGS